MPLYEYECDSCGHRFEVIQKFSDPLADTCPTCGAKVHKLFSSPAIKFKGSGWYITDYAKKDATAATKAGAAKDGSPNEGSAKENSTKEGTTKESTKDGSTSSSESGSTSSDKPAATPAPAPTSTSKSE